MSRSGRDGSISLFFHGCCHRIVIEMTPWMDLFPCKWRDFLITIDSLNRYSPFYSYSLPPSSSRLAIMMIISHSLQPFAICSRNTSNLLFFRFVISLVCTIKTDEYSSTRKKGIFYGKELQWVSIPLLPVQFYILILFINWSQVNSQNVDGFKFEIDIGRNWGLH